MPPKADKKTKVKALKGADAEQMVLDYMKATNRPYSSNDVSMNLKERVGKTEAARVLAALAEKGQITAKAYGKQTIFVYNQAQLEVLSTEDLATLDAAAKERKDEIEERKKALKATQSGSAKLAVPQTAQLAQTIQDLRASNEKLLKALAAYRGDGDNTAPPMTSDDMGKIDKDWTAWRKAWVERKKTYKEAVRILQDASLMSINLDAWEEEQGVEVDDEEAAAIDCGQFARPTASAWGGTGALGKRAGAPGRGSIVAKRARM